MINNFDDLLDLFACDSYEQLQRAIYTYTACGAWIKLLPDGVQLGTIVEGSDAELTANPLFYPFDEALFRNAIEVLERRADYAWIEANRALTFGDWFPEPDQVAVEGDYWDSHEKYTVTDWKYDVASDNTRLGYWEWVRGRIDEEEVEE